MDSQEIELISRAREGDQMAFARLVEKHDVRVMSLTRSILGCSFDAEEAYQEIFLKIYRSLPTFRFESDFSTWIHRIAVNTALSKRRSLQRRRQKEQIMDPLNSEDDFFDSVPHNPLDNPENQQLRSEILSQIERALEDIPARQRTVFVMKHDQGMKLKEIAKTLDCAVGTVMSRLHYARKRLQSLLREFHE